MMLFASLLMLVRYVNKQHLQKRVALLILFLLKVVSDSTVHFYLTTCITSSFLFSFVLYPKLNP